LSRALPAGVRFCFPSPIRITRTVKRVSLDINGGLERPAFEIVESIVQKEDLIDAQTKAVKSAAELVISERSQPAREQGPEVFRAEVHFKGLGCLEREGEKADGT